MHSQTLRSIGFSFSFALAVMTSGIVSAASFPDIAHSPYGTAIDFLKTNNVISGYDDGTFRPTATMNRAELLKIIVVSKAVTFSASDYQHCFPDVTTQWFAPAVCYAKKQGWISGYPDGMFKSEKTINVAEAIKIVIAANGEEPLVSPAGTLYADVTPGVWYAPYVSVAKNDGLLGWVTKKTLGANAGMTRGVASEMLYTQMSSGPLHFGSSAEQRSSLWSTLVTAMHRNGGSGQGGNGTATSGTTGGDVSLTTPTVTFNDVTKNYGDAPFILSPTSDSSGTFGFVSGNTTVVTVSGNTATIVGAGTATITATQAANGAFAGGSKAMTLTVRRIAPTITLANIDKNYGDAPFILSPTSNSDGALTFISGLTSIATVSGTTVTIRSAGVDTITINQAASTNYLSGSIYPLLTVHKATPTITFNTINKNYGDAPFTVTATSNSTGAITYTSSNTSVATISGSTVTILDAGTVTITATQAATGNYTPGSKDASLVISVIDACASVPCNGNGTCTRTSTLTSGALNSYSCACNAGWTGTNCDTIILIGDPAAFAPNLSPVQVACGEEKRQTL